MLDEIGRVLAIVNGEGRVETDGMSVQARDAGADRMKGAGPGQRDSGRQRRATAARYSRPARPQAVHAWFSRSAGVQLSS